MAIIGNSRLTKADLFVKSAAADLQDPTFLTFEIDFFPVPEEYPRYDGLMNSSLLPTDQSWFSAYSNNVATPSTNGYFVGGNGSNGFPQIQDDQYKKVEFSAYEWLLAYYGKDYGTLFNQKTPHPAQALIKMAKELSVIQDAPWYFQSISGVNDLWKQAHRVGQGDMKTTLTVSCLESIRRPLTTIAENYRWAVYDHERLSYRLPDNLRWFDMTVSLVEGRYLVDHAGPFSFLQIGSANRPKLFEYNQDNQLVRGLKVTTFKCKMCEFDFSDFLSGNGSQNDYTAYIQEKPFSPAFKINVGWVIHEEVNYEDSELLRQSGIFTGSLNAINNRLTRVLSTLTNIPNAVAGSLANKLQTTIDKAALGNVYSPGGLNGLANAVGQFGAALAGRLPVVGPGSGSAVNDRIYEDEPTKQIRPDYFENVYDEEPPGLNPRPATVRDAYPVDEPTKSIKSDDFENVYANSTTGPDPRPAIVRDVYPVDEPTPQIGTNDIGQAYPEPEPAAQVGAEDIGDAYPVPESPTQVGADGIGDIYPEPEQPDQIGPNDLGDVYP